MDTLDVCPHGKLHSERKIGSIYRIQNMKNQRTNIYKILYAHVLHSVTNIKYDEMNRYKTFSQNVIKISDKRRYVYYKN